MVFETGDTRLETSDPRLVELVFDDRDRVALGGAAGLGDPAAERDLAATGRDSYGHFRSGGAEAVQTRRCRR
jgi:hypothetical protein